MAPSLSKQTKQPTVTKSQLTLGRVTRSKSREIINNRCNNRGRNNNATIVVDKIVTNPKTKRSKGRSRNKILITALPSDLTIDNVVGGTLAEEDAQPLDDEDGIKVQVSASEDDFESESDEENGRIRHRSRSRSMERAESTLSGPSTSTDTEIQFMEHSSRAGSGSKTSLNIDMMIDRLVEKRLSEQIAEMEKMNKPGNSNDRDQTTPKGNGDGNNLRNGANGRNLIKSPSDTTIYTPALTKRQVNNTEETVDKISNFIENIRFGDSDTGRRQLTRVNDQSQPEINNAEDEVNELSDLIEGRRNDSTSQCSREPVADLPEAREATDRIILDAEKYKATIAPPKGMQMFQEDLRPYFKSELELRRFVDTDDDFFHMTCHVEDSLKAKIQRGEFVDLERLLLQYRNQLNNDRRPVEIVNVGGQTHIGTASQANTGKITGIRKWEQAF